MCAITFSQQFLYTPFISHIVSNKWMVTHWQVVVLISPILYLGVLVWYFLKNASVSGQNKFRGCIVVSIPACHAGDPGSIPGLGGFLFVAEELVMC